MRTGKNHEGYSDPTASYAVGHLTHEEKQREKRKKGNKSHGNRHNMLDNTHRDNCVGGNADAVLHRDGDIFLLRTEGRKSKKIHGGTKKGGRRADSVNKGDECKERRKAKEKTAKAE